MLYVFFLRRSRRRLQTYRYLGATSGRIFAATALELPPVYAARFIIAGWLLKDVVIRSTPLRYTVPVLGLGTYLPLFGGFAAVILLMLGLYMRAMQRTGRAEQEPLFSAGKLALRLRLRRVYLTLKSYWSGGVLTELILLMQVFFVAFPPPTRSPTCTSAAAAKRWSAATAAVTMRYILLKAGRFGRRWTANVYPYMKIIILLPPQWIR